jgi:hypothetical protein
MSGDSSARSIALTLILAVTACSPSSQAPPKGEQWSVVDGNLDRVPLCAWGSGSGDVLLGGGGLASDPRALLLRDDGHTLAEMPVPTTSTIWWIHGTSPTDVWAVGERGLILHWNGSAWSTSTSPTTANLYGVFAAAADDVWAVGGSPTGPGPNDVLVHYDGTAWTSVSPPRELGATYFKVWGLSSRDVHVVASAGLALHYDGTSWTEVPTGASATLITVHGGPGGVFAVGGPPPTLLRWDGGAWQKETLHPRMSGSLTGLFVEPGGTIFVTGEHYQRFRRQASSDTFADETDSPPLFGDLHGVWGDGNGNAVAVGGNYVALTAQGVKPKGIVVRYGQ